MRQYFLSFSELLDRLNIVMMKEINILDHKERYTKEKDILLHDIEEIIKEKNIELTKELLRNIIGLSQINSSLWYNLSDINTDMVEDYKKMKTTTDLNGMRNKFKNRIQEIIKEEDKKEYKQDCPEAK